MTEASAEGGDKAPLPGSPEYNEAMASAYRESKGEVESVLATQFASKEAVGTEQKTEASDKPVKPDNVPDKFWDAEKGVVRTDELLKSYTELESNKGKAAAEPATKDGQQQTPETDAEKAAKEAVTKAGLNWEDLGTKIASTGKIEDADYTALEAAGIPKNIVDEFIGLRAQAQDHATAASIAYVGGTGDPTKDAAATQDLLEWAGKTLSKEQVEGYNTMLASPNWKVAVDTLKTLRSQATPKTGEPVLLVPKTTTPGGTVVGYQTRDEMQADMGKPLYNEQSPAGAKFRAEVQDKMRLAAWRKAA